MSTVSKKQILEERQWIDSLDFNELYALHADWKTRCNLSQEVHFSYVRNLLLDEISMIPTVEYLEFVRQYNLTK